MATPEPKGTQTTIDGNQTDRAIKAVRDYQKGACTTPFVKDSLRALPPGSMMYVAIATRISVSALEALRDGAPA